MQTFQSQQMDIFAVDKSLLSCTSSHLDAR